MQHRELSEEDKKKGMSTEEEVFDDFINRFFLYRSGLTKSVKVDNKEQRLPVKEVGIDELKFMLENVFKFKIPSHDLHNYHERYIQGTENFDLNTFKEMLNSNLPETEEWKQQKAKALKKKSNYNTMMEQIKLSVKLNDLDAVKQEN